MIGDHLQAKFRQTRRPLIVPEGAHLLRRERMIWRQFKPAIKALLEIGRSNLGIRILTVEYLPAYRFISAGRGRVFHVDRKLVVQRQIEELPRGLELPCNQHIRNPMVFHVEKPGLATSPMNRLRNFGPPVRTARKARIKIDHRNGSRRMGWRVNNHDGLDWLEERQIFRKLHAIVSYEKAT